MKTTTLSDKSKALLAQFALPVSKKTLARAFAKARFERDGEGEVSDLKHLEHAKQFESNIPSAFSRMPRFTQDPLVGFKAPIIAAKIVLGLDVEPSQTAQQNAKLLDLAERCGRDEEAAIREVLDMDM